MGCCVAILVVPSIFILFYFISFFRLHLFIHPKVVDTAHCTIWQINMLRLSRSQYFCILFVLFIWHTEKIETRLPRITSRWRLNITKASALCRILYTNETRSPKCWYIHIRLNYSGFSGHGMKYHHLIGCHIISTSPDRTESQNIELCNRCEYMYDSTATLLCFELRV